MQIAVMIVDDDPVVRKVVGDLLAMHEAWRGVGVFAPGPEALAAAAAHPPDVMVVDISMPGMSGAEVTRRALEDNPSIQVMAYTALADNRSLAGMLNAGAAGVVYKDASIAAVADAIRATRSGLSVLSRPFNSREAQPELDAPLSDMELAILHLVSEGLTNDQIGRRVYLTSDGVKYHIANLSRKLGVRNRVMLAVIAVQHGLAGPSATSSLPNV